MKKTAAEILRRFGDPSENSDDQMMARCPAHEDRNASLSIKVTDDRILLHCHANCDTTAVVNSVGLQMSDLMLDEKTPTAELTRPHLSTTTSKPAKKNRQLDFENPVATFDYPDENGKLLYQAVRLRSLTDHTDHKHFRQRIPIPGGNWDYKLGSVRRVLYRLPELLASTSSRVFVAEGEKDVDNLRAIGLTATCNVGGAGKWKDEFSILLKNRDIVVCQDNDKAGVAHAKQVAESVAKFARSVKMITFEDQPEKSDISDWLATGKDSIDLSQRITSTDEYQPSPTIVDDMDYPLVEYVYDESKTNDEILVSLGKLGWSDGDEKSRVYSRGGLLVGLIEIDDPELPTGTLQIRALSEAILRERITQACRLFQTTKSKLGQDFVKTIRPPKDTVKQIRDRGSYSGYIRPLTGVIQSPSIRRDGSLIQTLGYDDKTGLTYLPREEFAPVPIQPTAQQIDAAKTTLCDNRKYSWSWKEPAG